MPLQNPRLSRLLTALLGGQLLLSGMPVTAQPTAAAAPAAAVSAQPDFALEPFPHPLAEGQCAGQLRLWPWDGDCDAMFVARFRRG